MAETAHPAVHREEMSDDLFLALGDMLPFRPEGWRPAAERRPSEPTPERLAQPKRLAA